MSQAGIISTTSGPVPPSVATSYVENTGTAVPVANVLNVLGTNGITTAGSGNTVSISIQNGMTANAVTTGATTANILTFVLAATPKSYTFDIRVTGISTVGNNAVGYNIFGTVKTDGTTATLVPTQDKIVNEDTLVVAADANIIVSGNNAIVQVLGVLGYTIDWGAFGVNVTST